MVFMYKWRDKFLDRSVDSLSMGIGGKVECVM